METAREHAWRCGWPIEHYVFGTFHVCDGCGHRWTTERPHPDGCPACGADVPWIASHTTQAGADRHKPLRSAAA